MQLGFTWWPIIQPFLIWLGIHKKETFTINSNVHQKIKAKRSNGEMPEGGSKQLGQVFTAIQFACQLNLSQLIAVYFVFK